MLLSVSVYLSNLRLEKKPKATLWLAILSVCVYKKKRNLVVYVSFGLKKKTFSLCICIKSFMLILQTFFSSV